VKREVKTMTTTMVRTPEVGTPLPPLHWWPEDLSTGQVVLMGLIVTLLLVAAVVVVAVYGGTPILATSTGVADMTAAVFGVLV
jgi:hypothetical protein